MSALRLPEVDWLARPSLTALADALGAGEGLVRYVGGAVRDALIGLPVADVDLATSLAPDEVAARIKAAGFKAVPTGLAHGTVTAVLPDGPVEVTTLRRDIATDGRHAVVAFTDDWRADAARRDFTVNALSADPRTRTVFDYFDGAADLAGGRVRFIGDPLQRIAEDHLRILRFFRFQARFGRGVPDAAALDACTARANDLLTLSRERIAQELLKSLAVADPVPAVTLMLDRGILRTVLPEVTAGAAAAIARLVARERAHGVPDPLRRLAALLPPDPATAEQVARRLRLSNMQRKRLALAAGDDLSTGPRALAYAIGTKGARDRLLLRADAGRLASAWPMLDGWTPPRLPLGGGALVALGLTPGPAVAAALAEIERRWIGEGFPGTARVHAIAAETVAQAPSVAARNAASSSSGRAK